MKATPTSSSPTSSRPEFDGFAAGYAAGMENPLKRLAGADADVFIDLKAWHMLGDLARRPLPAAPPVPRRLDFGCGAGAFLRALARRDFGGEMAGSDVSAGMLDEARKTWPAGRPSPTWSLSTPGRLPFANHSFDIVVALGVLHHVMPAGRPPEYREIARVLRPGGRCYIYEPNPFNPLTQWVVRHTAIDERRAAHASRGRRRPCGCGLACLASVWPDVWSAEVAVGLGARTVRPLDPARRPVCRGRRPAGRFRQRDIE